MSRKGENRFAWPTKLDHVNIRTRDILCPVQFPPKAISSRLYTLDEYDKINELFNENL